jgi:putative hydrolase of the HAD superfamily
MAIDAIFFDMGGTLRENLPRKKEEKVRIVQQIPLLLKSNFSPSELTELLESRSKKYEEWASKTLIELDDTALWTKWLLPDWPKEIISDNAMKLNEIWRDAICTRQMFSETLETILSLHQAGYRLGLVSNTTSSVDSPRMLKNEGLADYFEIIILSCVFGKRKPNPEILLEAVNKIGILPAQCAYIGDRPDWDVVAARAAGFGKTVILCNPNKSITDKLPPEQNPDYFIDNLLDLLDIFPPNKSITW